VEIDRGMGDVKSSCVGAAVHGSRKATTAAIRADRFLTYPM
jgi:hypothetical protein